MSVIVCNGKVDDEIRPGWIRNCPNCKKDIRYTVLNLDPGEDIYLYSDKTSDFLLLRKSLYSVEKDCEDCEDNNETEDLEKTYFELESTVVSCPMGGVFRIWSNIKCPHCHYEFLYNQGVNDKAIRFMENKVIWIEGAIAYRGRSLNSNRLISVSC